MILAKPVHDKNCKQMHSTVTLQTTVQFSKSQNAQYPIKRKNMIIGMRMAAIFVHDDVRLRKCASFVYLL